MLRILAFFVIAGAFGGAGYFLYSHYGNNAGAARQEIAVPVIVEPAARRELVDQIEAIGTTYAMESVTLTAPVTDPVVEIKFQDGQTVKKGDVLVSLDTSVLKAQLASAKATLDEAQKQLDRIQTLTSRGASTETRRDEQERIRDTAKAEVDRIAAEIDRRIIRAPFDGVVGFRRVSVGMLVQPGTELASLQDTSVLKLDFTVPELYLASLKQGQEIVARSPVYPDKRFSGKISAVESIVDPVSRAVYVRALIPNPDGTLAPGMLMTVGVIRERVMALMVPEEAVITLGDQRFLYRLEEGNTVKRVLIKTARRLPGYIEVVEGLKDGDTFVVDGVIRIKDGATVRPLPRGPGSNVEARS